MVIYKSEGGDEPPNINAQTAINDDKNINDIDDKHYGHCHPTYTHNQQLTLFKASTKSLVRIQPSADVVQWESRCHKNNVRSTYIPEQQTKKISAVKSKKGIEHKDTPSKKIWTCNPVISVRIRKNRSAILGVMVTHLKVSCT